MALTTEQLHPEAPGLDDRPLAEVTAVLIDAQIAAATAVKQASADIASAASMMAQTLADGGTVYYIAAGSSGLMAAADAQELGGTFSIPPERLKIVMAGGLPTDAQMPGDTEDETDGLDAAIADLGPRDTVIAVSASGSTPFTLKAVNAARQKGARIIGIANNAGTQLHERADIAITLPTPPEVLSGSTRLGAGTAQKIALNTLSTTMAVAMGHVHDGMMVNLRADNTKLRDRAARIVAHIASVDMPRAHDALEAAGGEIKLAALVAAHALSVPEARTRLGDANGRLRAALSRPS
ncbi:MAG: N-acetylmuramic acid 6-phosphate etherase [Devosiaceae bacterium]|nr:N-acetylmuramic acid 6-phosphate etherase [Devosiaceae bacterium MH13]